MTLLSVEEFRLFVTSALDDDALQILLDAAEQAIIARFGEIDAPYGVEEIVDGGQSYIFLRRRATSIDAITETDGTTETTLDADDYRLRGDMVSVLRLSTGTNPRTWWGAPVTVSYEAVVDEAERKRLQQALVKLDIGSSPGVVRERVGEWDVQQSSDSTSYLLEREALFDSVGLAYAQAPGFA